MVLINLLPWRAQAQQFLQRQRRFVLAGAVTMGVAAMLLLHILLQCWVNHLMQRVVELNVLVNQLQQRHQAAGASDPRYAQTIHQLAVYQAETRQFIRQLNEPHAPGVCFNKIARYKSGIHFDGYADSLLALSTFMTDWPAASHFDEIRIESLKHDHAGPLAFAFEGVEGHRVALSLVKQDHPSRA